jgi:hypothetical protein
MQTLTYSHNDTGTAPISPTCESNRLSKSGPAAPRGYHLGSADAVFLVVALLVFLTARQGLLDDPGLGWHLRNIDAMIAEHGWLTVDPFTEVRDGVPRTWYSNQWLGELPFWLGERWAGEEGIAAVAALVLAFTMRCLYLMLRRDGCPWPVAVFWISQAAMGVSCSWVARPNLFTLLFVAIVARVCILFHEGRLSRLRTLWLLPLFAVWANMHGGFLAGFILLGATFTLELSIALFSTSVDKRIPARRRTAHVLLLLVGTFLSSLINPYGLALYRWLFQLLGDPFFMDLHQEWKSPDFHGKGAIRFELLMLLFPFLLAVSKRRPHLVELGLALLWFHLALTGFRYVALWVVVVVPLLSRSSLAIPWVQEQAKRLIQTGKGETHYPAVRNAVPWLGSLVGAMFLFGIARGVQGRLAYHQPDIVPSQALDRFLSIYRECQLAQGRRPVVFHSYDWGGYLTWHGGSSFRNWIDDRNEVQGKNHIQDYFSIVATEPGWNEKLRRANVALVCIHFNAPLAYRLTERPAEWRERYRDAWAVVFERISASEHP